MERVQQAYLMSPSKSMQMVTKDFTNTFGDNASNLLYYFVTRRTIFISYYFIFSLDVINVSATSQRPFRHRQLNEVVMT
jgi:hypothetical protein